MAFPFFKKGPKGGRASLDQSARADAVDVSSLTLKETQDTSPASNAIVKKAKEHQGVFALRKTGGVRYTVSDYAVFVRPIVSEKALRGAEKDAPYVFEVASSANKLEIKKAFFNIYGVMPCAVRVAWQGGDTRRFGRIRGMTKKWKKAIVTLPKGQRVGIAT